MKRISVRESEAKCLNLMDTVSQTEPEYMTTKGKIPIVRTSRVQNTINPFVF